MQRRMLSKEDEAAAGADEVEVRREDQDKINRFSRLHQRELGLEDELKLKNKEKEDLEDVSGELELADEDELIPYKIGDSFIHFTTTTRSPGTAHKVDREHRGGSNADLVEVSIWKHRFSKIFIFYEHPKEDPSKTSKLHNIAWPRDGPITTRRLGRAQRHLLFPTRTNLPIRSFHSFLTLKTWGLGDRLLSVESFCFICRNVLINQQPLRLLRPALVNRLEYTFTLAKLGTFNQSLYYQSNSLEDLPLVSFSYHAWPSCSRWHRCTKADVLTAETALSSILPNDLDLMPCSGPAPNIGQWV
ncbi:hypothetical protein EYC80_000723 [Monilinia laxa]|uniref:Uncharacterized protein n=1 Tax=Monilinia laxa TaxID=61186 RepID=A0A5N6KBL3_MONLA|nr:hypothetical protein EYC80_000723 [Monilinia laxa]